MKKRNMSFAVGFVFGALLFGATTAYAAGILAERSTHRVTVDGRPVSVEVYAINGANYFKLRDIGELVDFGVTWNNDTQTVEIDTTTGYTPEQPAQPTADYYSTRVEVVERVNALRRANGQADLKMDPDLMAAAQVRAEEVANVLYSHTRPDGSENDTVVRFTGKLAMGENIGAKDHRGLELSDVARVQTESWQNSAAHYRNLLRADYHSTGVGIAQDKFGMYFIVQVFTRGEYTITGIDDPILP